MPAFTQLCHKVNISIFENTMTIYPKIAIPGTTSYFPEVNLFLKFHISELKFTNYIFRSDAEHEKCHNDSFLTDDRHTHLKFSQNIDEVLLTKILNVLVQHKVLSTAEQTSFLTAFKTIKVELKELDGLAQTPVSTTNPSAFFSSQGGNNEVLDTKASQSNSMK